MQYEDISAPIEATVTGEAYKVVYVTRRGGIKRYLCGWTNHGPLWSEKRRDAIWVGPSVGHAIRKRFGSYLTGIGRIRLLDRPPLNEDARLAQIVGDDYWRHLTD